METFNTTTFILMCTGGIGILLHLIISIILSKKKQYTGRKQEKLRILGITSSAVLCLCFTLRSIMYGFNEEYLYVIIQSSCAIIFGMNLYGFITDKETVS